MSPITHFLVGWTLAEAVPNTTPKERALVALAGVIPDLDGVGAVVDKVTYFTSDTPTELFATYHHDLHTLPFAVVCSALALLALGRGATVFRRILTAGLVFLSFHLHVLCDVLGSRGPDGHAWPIHYLEPLPVDLELVWSGQWELNAWPNFLLTGVLLVLAFVLAVRRGYSPLGIFSSRIDLAFVRTLRARFAPARLSERDVAALAVAFVPSATTIELGPDERVWVTGDVHIAPEDEDRAKEFLAFLEAARAGCDRLVLLGDVFDFWIGPAHARGCCYRGVVEAFEAAEQAGFPIDFIAGNRDFLGLRELRSIGVRPQGDAVIYARGEERTVVTHGDLLVQGDHSYRRYRAVVRSALFRLCYWLVPTFIRLWAAHRLRGASTRKLSRVEPYSFPIDLRESEAWLEHFQARDLLMGHLHREETHDHGQGRATRMIPGWGPGRAPHFVVGPPAELRATTSPPGSA